MNDLGSAHERERAIALRVGSVYYNAGILIKSQVRSFGVMFGSCQAY
jgi:hypothetical protein